MNSILLFVFAMASNPNSNGQASGGNPAISLLPIVMIFLIMYLLIFRPQAKRQKEHRAMLDNLQKGDEVVTAGGIYGQIVGTKRNDTVVILKIADNVKIDVTRSSIAQKAQPESSAKN